MTAQEAFELLKEGNARFVANQLEHPHISAQRKIELKNGQEPFAIVLGCADSRVPAEIAFDQGLGDIFTIRVAGNIANTESIASIEYAVAHLDTKLIIVLGHESCGAVGAAIAGGDNGHNLNMLLAHITPAISSSEGSSMEDIVKNNARLNAQHMIDRSPILQTAIEKDGVEVKCAYYHFETGEVEYFD